MGLIWQAFNEMLEAFALHRIIVDEAGAPIDYEFLNVNPAFERLTGLKGADIIGRTAREVLPDLEDGWIIRYGSVALTAEPLTFEMASRSLGRTYEVRAYSPAKDLFAALFTDVTDRVAAERDLARSARALETLNAVSAAVDTCADRAEFLSTACEAAVQLGGYHTAIVGDVLHDEARSIAPVAFFSRNNDLTPLASTWGSKPKGGGVAGAAVREKRLAYARDTHGGEDYAAWRETARAQGYRSAIAIPVFDALGEVVAVFGVTSSEVDAFDTLEAALLQELALEISRGLRLVETAAKRAHAERSLADSYEALQRSFLDLSEAMGRAVEVRDAYTQGHQQRVADLASRLALELNMPETEREGLRVASLLHDVGKLGVPIDLLTKPGHLTQPEFSLIQSHALRGYEVLKDVAFPWPVADAVLQHHERLDGSGYPNHLVGDEIGSYARIIAVADVVEAMVSDRPYRPALPIDMAWRELEDNAAKYDPRVVEALRALDREGFLVDWASANRNVEAPTS